MEEVRAHADQAQLQAMSRSPHEVLAELQKGNTRFWTNRANRPEKSVFERRALISRQFPSVAVLGCSDSRVPTEMIFDQGLGDIFVIRGRELLGHRCIGLVAVCREPLGGEGAYCSGPRVVTRGEGGLAPEGAVGAGTSGLAGSVEEHQGRVG
mmetsp:Transcript_69989/g.177649  ORF Transcript_69989/g.177649 Transcript_69989/m.177649 type:complete len:153 (-) Transcript_69989:839-1297(-)